MSIRTWTKQAIASAEAIAAEGLEPPGDYDPRTCNAIAGFEGFEFGTVGDGTQPAGDDLI